MFASRVLRLAAVREALFPTRRAVAEKLPVSAVATKRPIARSLSMFVFALFEKVMRRLSE